MSSSCLVTGGAGFIGSSIARALLARGDQVRVLDDFSTGKRENLADLAARIDLHEGDIRDDAALERALAGVEVVFHEAAIPSVPRSLVDPLTSHDVDATGTLKVLFHAKKAGVRRVVYAASSAAYGDTPTLPKIETMRPAPLSPYAVAKLAGELYCQMYATAYGLETVSLRYFNVFGARQDPQSEYAAVIPRFVTAALRGEGVTIYGDGTQSRDFCYIDNTVEANLLAAFAPAALVSGRMFNVACGEATTLNQVIELLGPIVGKKIPVTYAPARVGDVKHSLADIGEARARLGYKGDVSFLEGLRRSVAWYVKSRAD
ncbi:MAG: UDP-galacturonate 4-epimerase [Myxococcales bacterium]|jgi:nucleoside-diphosphate-sugar epimerase|nr:UDP-galacturonate 4-epimerase [Myxococcales bacterium]